MAWLDWLWVGLVLTVWCGAQALMALAVWDMWRRERERTPQTDSWDDSFDNWYPDYPFNDSKTKGEKTIRQEPDKHEEEE